MLPEPFPPEPFASSSVNYRKDHQRIRPQNKEDAIGKSFREDVSNFRILPKTEKYYPVDLVSTTLLRIGLLGLKEYSSPRPQALMLHQLAPLSHSEDFERLVRDVLRRVYDGFAGRKCLLRELLSRPLPYSGHADEVAHLLLLGL